MNSAICLMHACIVGLCVRSGVESPELWWPYIGASVNVVGMIQALKN